MHSTNYNYYKYCMVPQCESSSRKTPEKVFIYVPNNDKVRKTWLKLAKRTDAHSLSAKSRMYFCEDHFDLENDMENYIKYKLVGGVIKLKKEVVPHKFACHNTNNGPRQGLNGRVAKSDDVQSTKVKGKRNANSFDRVYSIALKTSIEEIIGCIYEFFKKEYEYIQEHYGHLLDMSLFCDYKDRTAKATGFDTDVISRVLKELSVNGGYKKRKVKKNDKYRSESLYYSNSDSDSKNTNAAEDSHIISKTQSKPTQELSIQVKIEATDEEIQRTQPTQELSIKVETHENDEELKHTLRLMAAEATETLEMDSDTYTVQNRSPATQRNRFDVKTENDILESDGLSSDDLEIKEEMDIGEEIP